ncbi:DUF554 domain-containing protein [Acidaminococcus timonensis]|uniref:DUF554 domain-containing protein n=1 Tax=Acidaminococcus timonensis TaxID=1871002 RepID=UPI0025E4828E|nr:DUF554 domain-containing protein [Acidaminococcus timonensis]
MVGTGTIVNVAAIAAGSLVGLLVGRGIKEKYQETVIYGLALCVILLGLQMAFQGRHILITIVSLVIGSILGEALDIEDKLEKVGLWLAQKVQKAKRKGNADTDAFVEGFLSTSLLYCVGAMAIVGSIQDGLTGDATTLYTKALIDGLSGIIYASNMGIGVLFSALSVGVYQGTLTALAGLLGPYMSQTVVQEIAASGGLMILAVGINMTKLLKIRVGNMLPGLVVAGVLARIFL